ncbi:DUF2777 domain-containing protein [Geobacillus zalihae]|uniref:DUF2777 domain-containing protein n=1 Tax=Geobacillus zalihae TaxID=213419 RepID=A0A7H1RUQ1_9BACL|nr:MULTISPECIES: DUF2777 domain-containing protein [Geobacillus]ADI27804.1 hypothetical protein GC56T3_2862 [Geobacillus sp. C56-T3]AMQ19765.1 hypothetical protein A0V43_00865 [Geobacillus sp. JS12]EPR28531.1 hypothetical protein I656_01824 [Geobacillus sp. WSUCF1]OQP24441.1 hypothetical protein B1694_04220 [Geobacillus zalihae]QNU17990.1 DUF2777 domain-containing protein [Geobacillus zalihae]
MNIEERLQCIVEQPRAYVYGTVEFVNDEWIFFDEEEEEASLVEEIAEQGIEWFHCGHWLSGQWQDQGAVATDLGVFPLENGDRIRFRKRLTYAYQQWLAALSDSTFFQFVQWLNSLGFSLYDCLYCYNGLLFAKSSGVNFIIYDNTEQIGSIHHYYERGRASSDRFEITLNSGERAICAQIG